MKILLTASSVLLLALGLFAAPATPANDEAAVKEPAETPMEKLERENELLRKENQALRRQVVALRSRLGASAAEGAGKEAEKDDKKAEAAAAKVQPDKENDEHWLSSGSKKRHNSSCRYFKQGKGAMCSEKDGTPCKVCGG